MRILFFMNGMFLGGKERRLTELMKVLNLKSDIEFELVVMRNYIEYQEIFDLNIKIHYLIRKIKRDPTVFQSFYKICKNYKPDIVNCWDSMTAIIAVPACKLLNIKLVNSMVVDSPVKQNVFNKNWFRAKLTFPFSDIIIGNSKAGLAAYNAPKNKSIFIYNGFNFERTKNIIKNGNIREQLNINKKYVVGMVAEFSEYKDYKTYFSAAQLILSKRNDIIFLAIGSNTDSNFSKSLIDDKYKEYCRLLGGKSGIESFINIMDIGVLSTFTEGVSNSILEYMALEKPVIATSGGGTNEIIIDEETGFLISKSNPEELAEKIEILLNDNDLRNKMGKAGKKRIEDYFSINSMVNNYINNYNKILTKSTKKKIKILEKLMREAIAFLLIQIYYVTERDHDGIFSIYFHNPSKVLFEKILKWLVGKGYKFISIKDLDYNIHHKKKEEKLVVICFDDGWRGNLELIETIEKFKVPITIFIPTDAIEDGNYWWEYAMIKGQEKYSGIKRLLDFKMLPESTFKEKIAILKQHYCLERSCINLDELKKINENELITIGSHTVMHPILTRCSYETQTRELMNSKRIITQWLNQDVVYLSYPNGDYNENTIEIAKACSYKLCFTTNSGKIDIEKVNPFMIPRNSIYDNGGFFENISKIMGIWQKIFTS